MSKLTDERSVAIQRRNEIEKRLEELDKEDVNLRRVLSNIESVKHIARFIDEPTDNFELRFVVYDKSKETVHSFIRVEYLDSLKMLVDDIATEYEEQK